MSTTTEPGDPDLKTAVTLFYNRVLNDPEVAPWFEGVDLARLRAHQRAFLAYALGAGGAYTGRALEDAHRGREITESAFDIVVAHLMVALSDVGMADEAMAALRTRIEAARDAIVTAAS